MFRRRNSCMDSSGSIPVYLNVYDIYSFNGYAYWFGLGVFHSGVQVHGMEYAYGAHKYPTTGIFEGEAKHCEGFTFRKGILIGWTELSARQVRELIEEELAEMYMGNEYHLITKNCNHFCNDFCIRLTGNPIPNWVNRLARIGFHFNCLIPANVCRAEYQQSKTEDKVAKVIEEDKEELGTCSNSNSSSIFRDFRFCSISSSPSSSAVSCSQRRSVSIMPSSSSTTSSPSTEETAVAKRAGTRP
ncbi:hypothetical protein Dimus_027868 [Dionaea muscipula]